MSATEVKPNQPAVDERLQVGPAWIADHVNDASVRIVEIDVSANAYTKGHIPGAVLWNPYTDLRHADYSPIDDAEFAGLLTRSGIEPATTVVLYGYGAYLGFWLLGANGHERLRVMDGARERWTAAGYEWSGAVPAIEPARDARAIRGYELVTAAALCEAIERPDVLILDVRSAEEFAGERFWPSGATYDVGRKGHIPGAINLPCDLLRRGNGELKDASELRPLCEAHGVGPGHRVVTYCTIGNRASVAWFALRHVLGYPDVSVYYGSWVEWGRRADTPIEGSRA
jgi:thiosulfate/3-mercaptopyruvate sulfurtransferase